MAKVESFFVRLDGCDVTSIWISDICSGWFWCNMAWYIVWWRIRRVGIGIVETGVGEVVTFLILYQRTLFRHNLFNDISNLWRHWVGPVINIYIYIYIYIYTKNSRIISERCGLPQRKFITYIWKTNNIYSKSLNNKIWSPSISHHIFI